MKETRAVIDFFSCILSHAILPPSTIISSMIFPLKLRNAEAQRKHEAAYGHCFTSIMDVTRIRHSDAKSAMIQPDRISNLTNLSGSF